MSFEHAPQALKGGSDVDAAAQAVRATVEKLAVPAAVVDALAAGLPKAGAFSGGTAQGNQSG